MSQTAYVVPLDDRAAPRIRPNLSTMTSHGLYASIGITEAMEIAPLVDDCCRIGRVDDGVVRAVPH